MSRGAKIAIGAVGVAVVAITIVVAVMVEHLDDGTHAASKRVTPDSMKHFDTIVFLPRDTSTYTVSDVEDRMNRLHVVDQYAEVSHKTLAYLVSRDGAGAKSLFDQVCAQPTARGYAVALTKPVAEARRALVNALGRDAVVRPATYQAPKTEIFMRVRATQEQTAAVKNKLEDDPDIEGFRFLDHLDAYNEFKRLFADQPVLIEGEQSDGRGLPQSFRLNLRDGASPAAIVARYGKLPGVNQVTVPTSTGVPSTELFDVCKASAR